MSSTKPLILIVYADSSPKLSFLEAEACGIRDSLRGCPSCEIELVPWARSDDLLSKLRLPRYQEQVAVFHFAGHANGEGLMFGAEHGPDGKLAYIEGLAGILGQLKNLSLVFLNGCSTREQTLHLFQNGIPVTIATSCDIRDDVASSFAIEFYKGLGVGHGIETAFLLAGSSVTAAGGGGVRALCHDVPGGAVNPVPWSWILCGGRDSRDWTLDSAAASSVEDEIQPEHSIHINGPVKNTVVGARIGPVNQINIQHRD